MAEQGAKRKLAAILSADVAGYSRLMADDEAATVETLTRYRRVFADYVERHDGRVVDSPGDNVLAEFASPVEAVECAVDIQRELARRNRQLAEHRRMEFRIGVNLGDVIARDDGTIYGDGVNIAARLEGLAKPGGVMISEDVHRQVRTKLDLGFADAGSHQVKNIPEPVRAYRVVAEASAKAGALPSAARRRRTIVLAAAVVVIVAGVGAWQAGLFTPEPSEIAQETATAEEDDAILALPTGPSIAVLPFVNMSGDPDQDYFADGISEEIIAALTRFSDLFVIARNTTFQYKGRSVDVREVGREIGARYIVEGSVRRSADTVRVTAQLLDASDGGHLWAETYERDLTASDIFALQDEITDRIVATIGGGGGVISHAGMAAVRSKSPEDLTAYECVLRYYAYIRALLPKAHGQARDCLERAVELAPDYDQAWAALSSIYRHEHAFGFNPRPRALERAYEAAQRAVELAPQNQLGYTVLALAHFHRHELEQAFIAAERALALNPNDASLIAILGLQMAYAGEWDRGVSLTKKAMALNPNHADWYHFPIVFDHFNKGEYDQALVNAQKMNLPRFFWAHATRAAIFGHLGRRDDAEKAVAELLALYPDFTDHARDELRKWNFAPDLIERTIDGLRKAGLDIAEPPAAAE